ncbi:MAG: hypothetical protein R2757_13535 [Draconibacterium sp.]
MNTPSPEISGVYVTSFKRNFEFIPGQVVKIGIDRKCHQEFTVFGEIIGSVRSVIYLILKKVVI